MAFERPSENRITLLERRLKDLREKAIEETFEKMREQMPGNTVASARTRATNFVD